MEGVKIYEESSKEIARILKTLTATNFSINMDKLDGQTKQELITAIRDVLCKRSKEIEKVTLGVQ